MRKTDVRYLICEVTSIFVLSLQRCAATACVRMRCAPAVCDVHALRACCVCIVPMLVVTNCKLPIRHETCAGVWACSGQRHFVPSTKSPLSTQQRTPTRGTSCVGRCWSGEKRPTHCAAVCRPAQSAALHCSESLTGEDVFS
jgi:hypothetical protein